MRQLSKSRIFLILCLAFIAGVCLRSVVVPIEWFLCGVGLVGLSVIALCWNKVWWRVVGFCLLFFVCGIVRYDLAIPRVNGQVIQYYNNQKVRFAGVVAAEPDVRVDHVKLNIVVKQGITGAQKLVRGHVLVKTPSYPEYQYGDLLDIECALQTPEPIEDFAYDKYLARFGIYSVCYRPVIILVAHDQGNVIMAGLLSVKSRFVEAVQLSLSEPFASFLGGLILGAKRSIPDDLMQAFNRTGTTHIVALSGYNITIIGVLVMNVCELLWLSRKKAFWVSLGVIIFFILITGASASVVRAGIMGMLVLLATQLGRLSRITNALVLAAAVMVLVNPRVLMFDAGFQLSFLATVGLIFVSPQAEKIAKKLPSVFSIKENLTATVSATVMTLPLIAWQFGRVSLVAPLVNVLILPLIPLAMGLGFVMGILALVWLPLGQTFGWVVWLVLRYIIFIVEMFSKLPFASINL